MPIDERCLSYLGLAYEYFIMDMEEEGLRLIHKMVELNADFFDKPLGLAMKKDPKVVEIAQVIIAKLVEIGYLQIRITSEVDEDIK